MVRLLPFSKIFHESRPPLLGSIIMQSYDVMKDEKKNENKYKICYSIRNFLSMFNLS